MKKNLIIVWKVVAGLSVLLILWSILALNNDTKERAIIEDWTILGSSLSALLFSLTFMALLEEKNNSTTQITNVEVETPKPIEDTDATKE